MGEACRALDFPVVSGNVSLYNETNGSAIPPTPTVGAVGLIPDYVQAMGYGRMRPGDTLVLIGVTRGELGASLYLREGLAADGPGDDRWAPPPVDLAAEKRHGDLVRTLIREGGLHAVHDLSDGGLIGAAAEMALASGLGVELRATSALNAHGYLFGEDQGRYLLATPDPQTVLERAREAGVRATDAGHVGGEAFASASLFAIALADLRQAHEGWMPAFMDVSAT